MALGTGRLFLALSALLFFVVSYPAQSAKDRVQLRLNTEESEAVLAILAKHKAAQRTSRPDHSFQSLASAPWFFTHRVVGDFVAVNCARLGHRVNE